MFILAWRIFWWICFFVKWKNKRAMQFFTLNSEWLIGIISERKGLRESEGNKRWKFHKLVRARATFTLFFFLLFLIRISWSAIRAHCWTEYWMRLRLKIVWYYLKPNNPLFLTTRRPCFPDDTIKFQRWIFLRVKLSNIFHRVLGWYLKGDGY